MIKNSQIKTLTKKILHFHMLWRPPFIGKALQQTLRFDTNSNSNSYPKSSAQNSNLKTDMGAHVGAQTILESGMGTHMGAQTDMGTHVGAQKLAEYFFPLVLQNLNFSFNQLLSKSSQSIQCNLKFKFKIKIN